MFCVGGELARLRRFIPRGCTPCGSHRIIRSLRSLIIYKDFLEVLYIRALQAVFPVVSLENLRSSYAAAEIDSFISKVPITLVRRWLAGLYQSAMYRPRAWSFPLNMSRGLMVSLISLERMLLFREV